MNSIQKAFIMEFEPRRKREFVEFDPTRRKPQEPDAKSNSPLAVQVGGDYYRTLKIQPVEYAYANKLDYFQGAVVKYVTRFRQKNGKQDLEKAIHVLQLLIELEYGGKTK